jgi:hypothetical protein
MIKENAMKYLLTILLILSCNLYAGEQDGNSVEESDASNKVCVLTLKGKKQTVAHELETYNCAKGDVLYLTEVQLIGMTQHTVAMSAARACDLREDITTFALQSTITTVCKYSGEVLPIVGHKKTLKMGDQFIKAK